MEFFKIIIFLIILVIFTSCSNQVDKKSEIKENSLELQVYEAYKEGIDSLESGDVLFAAKKFNEAEILYPQSTWAPRSALMAAYSYYIQDYYGDAIAELERYLIVYPLHKNIDYAYYLLSLCYYEQIVDETRDLQSINNAKKNFQIVLDKFPNTDYALDASFKIDLIDDILASKEIYLGRYYFDKKKWIASINRFKSVVDNYNTTIYVEEALHRLVEIYYTLGLIDESKKYAQLLGYNYQSSRWYERTYAIFDKSYEENKKNNLKKKSKVIKKIKSLF